MSNIVEQLAYVYVNHTQSWISENTGIPASTLSYVLSGQRELPAVYNDAAMGVYQREVAARLFQAGAPENQANRFVLLNPNDALSKEEWIDNMANRLTNGYIISQIVNEDISQRDIQAFINDNYADAKVNIVSSLQRSEKPIEEWTDY